MLVDLQACAAELPTDPVVNSVSIAEVPLPSSLRSDIKRVVRDTIAVGPYSSSMKIEGGNVVCFPNQYFRFAAAVHDFALELGKYFEVIDEFRPDTSLLAGNESEIEAKLKASTLPVELSASDITLLARFMANDDDQWRLKGKAPINGTQFRGSSDCFGSVVLKTINTPLNTTTILGTIIYDLAKHSEVYAEIVRFYSEVPSDSTSAVDVRPLPKPFVLLAGISGTGKTRFVREQAERHGVDAGNHLFVAVRPDWHEPSDLLGYVSRIGDVHFVTTPLLSFMAKAWREAINRVDSDGCHLRELTEIKTYWVCLDEMNLAPVEQYFADFLAVIETRDFEGRRYRCAPILNVSNLNLDAKALNRLRTELGFEEGDELWQHFVDNGMPLPPNMVVAGTVNMDETTHGFSRKVIDRAFTIDFGEFFPNEFGAYFSAIRLPVTLTFPRWSSVSLADLASVPADSDGAKSIKFLESINSVLADSPFSLAFRALNELLVAVRSFTPTDDVELAAVWDDFLMTKVLPRLEGDAEKMDFSGAQESLLTRLRTTIEATLLPPLSKQGGANGMRPDLLQRPANPLGIELRSLKALDRMQRRLVRHNFTSFWP